MLCKQLSDDQLHELRDQALSLSQNPQTSDRKHQNLRILLQLIEDELCIRCRMTSAKECSLSAPTGECFSRTDKSSSGSR